MHTTKHTHKLAQLAYLLVAHPFIYSITFYEVLLKHLICPLAELHTALALNAITNGRNHFKIEIFNFMSLSFPLHSTMLSGIRKFCDYLFAFQFLLKSIIDMLTDSCIITIKQISQLLT